jgi:hypothetical protein
MKASNAGKRDDATFAPATPRRIFSSQASDEIDDRVSGRRTPDRSRLFDPESSEAATVPRYHCRRLHDCQRIAPSRPGAREHGPERSVERMEAQAWLPTLEYRDLMPKGEVFGDES